MNPDIAAKIANLRTRLDKRLATDDAVAVQKNATCAAMVMGLLHSATVTHLMHFQTRSYAAHVALGEYYDGIVEITDRFVEAYQGRYGILAGYPEPMPAGTEPLPYLQTLRQFVDEARKGTAQDSHLQNIVDEAVALIDATIYKLTFLA